MKTGINKSNYVQKYINNRLYSRSRKSYYLLWNNSLDEVAIIANSVVTNDLPARRVAVGIPSKVISTKGSTGYILNHYTHNDTSK